MAIRDRIGVGGGINWALIVNMLMFAAILFGGWFASWSGPTNEKFSQIERSMQQSLAQHEKDMTAMHREIDTKIDAGVTAQSLVNKDFETSLERRFRTQDKANDELRLVDGEIKSRISELEKQIESRRIEAATRAELVASLSATRLELLSEVRRLDSQSGQAMPRSTFEVWRNERDILVNQMLKRLDAFELSLQHHVTQDRELDRERERPGPRPQSLNGR